MTFMMKLAAQGSGWREIEYPYVKEFVALGETWVVHHDIRITKDGKTVPDEGSEYRVSHKEIGMRVPAMPGMVLENAETLTTIYLESKREALQGVLDAARVKFGIKAKA